LPAPISSVVDSDLAEMTNCLNIRSKGQHVILPALGAHSYWTMENREHGALVLGIWIDMVECMITRNAETEISAT